MAKRPGAAALACGALLALLHPSTAVAQDGETYAREISGGYASWTTAAALTLDVTEPAVQGAANRAWFPATDGGTNPETGDMEVELGGVAQLGGPSEPLTFGGLRLELGGGSGNLYVRTATDGQARELALADVSSGGADPVVRTAGVTWTGLRASLTEEGAKLLTEWSGQEFTRGGDLGLLDVAVGTGSSVEAEPEPEETAEPSPSPTTAKKKPSASVTRTAMPAGAEQQVTGAGFEPGEIILVAIDADTRYQAVADAQGRLSQAFPVYSTAAEGVHAVELHTVSGARKAATQFEVVLPTEAALRAVDKPRTP
ncbi:hypothetical protein ACI2L1_32120 [Streptomyces sp. NPDC019531]|uniref:hypothetical protein n=1 Tax=Streptomyces sp. NPDC019531 TaxID=3365062 RepID=UPI00384A6853